MLKGMEKGGEFLVLSQEERLLTLQVRELPGVHGGPLGLIFLDTRYQPENREHTAQKENKAVETTRLGCEKFNKW